jgi:hypothetical protein
MIIADTLMTGLMKALSEDNIAPMTQNDFASFKTLSVQNSNS